MNFKLILYDYDAGQYSLTEACTLPMRPSVDKIKIVGLAYKPEQGRWLRKACRQCTSLLQKGSDGERARHGSEGTGVLSQMGS